MPGWAFCKHKGTSEGGVLAEADIRHFLVLNGCKKPIRYAEAPATIEASGAYRAPVPATWFLTLTATRSTATSTASNSLPKPHRSRPAVPLQLPHLYQRRPPIRLPQTAPVSLMREWREVVGWLTGDRSGGLPSYLPAGWLRSPPPSRPAVSATGRVPVLRCRMRPSRRWCR